MAKKEEEVLSEAVAAEESGPVNIQWFDPKDFPEPRLRIISEDKGGGQVNVTLAEGEPDKYVQLRLNGKTVDSKKSVNSFVQLRFPKGWPVGDFQYKVV